MIVLDEADEVLDRGFLDMLKEILPTLPKTVQTLVSSSTCPLELLEFCENTVCTPFLKITHRSEYRTLEGIRQYYVVVHKEESKPDVIVELLQNLDIPQTIVYVSSLDRVETVSNILNANRLAAAGLASEDKQQQEAVVRSFRIG